MSTELEYLEREVDKDQEDIKTIRDALYTLIEAQKNTTKNVDSLTLDVKGLIKNNAKTELILSKLEIVEARVKELETSKTWEYRILIGAIISGVVTFAIKFGIL